MPAPDPKTPLARRASMPSTSTTMGPPEFMPISSRTPKEPSFPRPPKRALSPHPTSSPSTALPMSGEASSAPIVTPARREREYGTYDSPCIPDIHPTPIRRPRRTPVRRHSANPLAQLGTGIPADDRLVSDKKYRAQRREHTVWMIATEGTLSSSPGIRIEEVADEDSDEEDRENFREWCREERRKRRLAEQRERERREERREREREEMGEEGGEETGEETGEEGEE